jgi:hypothetical protein
MKGCQWARECCCPKKREHCRNKNAAIYSPISGLKEISALFVWTNRCKFKYSGYPLDKKTKSLIFTGWRPVLSLASFYFSSATLFSIFIALWPIRICAHSLYSYSLFSIGWFMASGRNARCCWNTARAILPHFTEKSEICKCWHDDTASLAANLHQEELCIREQRELDSSNAS